MNLIVVALPFEAKPIINHLILKKNTSYKKFDVYENDTTKLIISGVGAIKSAIAATSLLSSISCLNNINVFNMGICGSSIDVPIGNMVVINKITNLNTKFDYYPDILLKHDMYEGSLCTCPYPLSKDNCALDNYSMYDFYDMESAGFIEASSTFVKSHKIHCLKVVSDYLDGTKLNPKFINELINNNIFNIEKILKQSSILNLDAVDILNSNDIFLISKLEKNLKLSTSMSYQLKNIAKQYKLSTNNELTCINSFRDIIVNSKLEGKLVFEKIKKTLLEV